MLRNLSPKKTLVPLVTLEFAYKKTCTLQPSRLTFELLKVIEFVLAVVAGDEAAFKGGITLNSWSKNVY